MIDNSFVNILVLRGYISFGIMLVAFWMLGRQAKMKKDLWLCAVLCVIAVHSVIDPQLLSLEYNGLLLIFATYFSDRKAVT